MAMTNNDKGYLVYLWTMKGYHFAPAANDGTWDYSNYLNYYTDPAKNKALIDRLIKEHNNG